MRLPHFKGKWRRPPPPPPYPQRTLGNPGPRRPEAQRGPARGGPQVGGPGAGREGADSNEVEGPARVVAITVLTTLSGWRSIPPAAGMRTKDWLARSAAILLVASPPDSPETNRKETRNQSKTNHEPKKHTRAVPMSGLTLVRSYRVHAPGPRAISTLHSLASYRKWPRRGTRSANN